MYPFEEWLQQAGGHRRSTGRPLVSLCYAQSLDGSLASQRDRPLALSGPQSSLLTHKLRALHAAILLGIGAVLADDPLLTVRLAPGRSPQPVILDSHLRTPLSARLLHPERQAPKPWIATSPQADPQRCQALQAAGARLLFLPGGPQGGIALPALLDCLAELGIDSLMVEGGAEVISSFLAQGLADFVVVTIAPCFVGGWNVIAPGAIRNGFSTGANFPRLHTVGSEQLGEDILVWGKLR